MLRGGDRVRKEERGANVEGSMIPKAKCGGCKVWQKVGRLKKKARARG